MHQQKEQKPRTTSNAASQSEEQTDTRKAGEPVSDNLQTLRNQLQSAEQKRDEYLDLAKRAQADFENYQKRMKRDLADERRYAQAPLAGDLLSALDNLERAMAAAEQAGEKGPLVQGVAMVHTQILDTLRRHGVTRIEAQGQPFDPNQHQAVMQQPNKDYPAMTVVQVLEPGYMIHERVLRPARVAVSTVPEHTVKS
jgi:molecular chaperone GrpE